MTIDDEAEVEAEDVPPFTMCPHWVLLAELSPQAKVLWWALASHVYRRKRDGAVVWPSRQSLAAMLQMKRPQSIDPYLTELDEYGAIKVEPVRLGKMRVRHRYVVRFKPPAGCSTPLTVEEFYERRPSMLSSVGTAG